MSLGLKSILSRIVVLHLLAIVVTCIAVPLAASYFLERTVARNIHKVLSDHAIVVAKYLTLDDLGHWQLNLPAEQEILYHHAYSGLAYSVLDDSGQTLFASPHGKDLALKADRSSAKPSYFSMAHGPAIYQGIAIRKSLGNKTAWIEVARNLEDPDVRIDNVVSQFFRGVPLFTVPILLLLLAVDTVIVHRALRPIMEASNRAELIDPVRLDVRLPDKGLPLEVRPLVRAVNQALERLEHGFKAQRDFVADAAHELRTPLAVLRMRVDTMNESEALKALRRDIDGMSRIITQLLEIAELEIEPTAGLATTDLQAVCSEAVERLAPLAIAQGKSIALTGTANPVTVRGNPEVLMRAILNLTENAITHTRAGSEVEVEVTAEGSVRVLDYGPGVPEAERELIFRRFWRRNRAAAGHAGLGLSIVSRIADAYGGTVFTENRAGGGATFTLQLAPV